MTFRFFSSTRVTFGVARTFLAVVISARMQSSPGLTLFLIFLLTFFSDFSSCLVSGSRVGMG